MNELNPYAPPAANLGDEAPTRPPAYRLYMSFNLLYAALVIVCLLVLLVGGNIQLALRDGLVAGIFLAPVLSFTLVTAHLTQVFRYWRFAQALIIGVLLVFCLEDLGRGSVVGIGLFMTLVNALSLITSSYFYRLKQANRKTPGALASGPSCV